MLPRVNVLPTRIGQFLLFDTQDFISQYLKNHGTWEPQTLELTTSLLRGVARPDVLDVGANLGAYTIPVATHVAERSGRVCSFEPQRTVFQQLCGNIFLNRLDNVFAHNLAVSDRVQTLSMPVVDYALETNVGALSLSTDVHQGRGETIARSEPVQATTLDVFATSLPSDFRCALLKIDVEGMELEVLQGAGQFLSAHDHPPILFEVWSEKSCPWYQGKKEKILNHLVKLGYEPTLLGGDMGVAKHPARKG